MIHYFNTLFIVVIFSAFIAETSLAQSFQNLPNDSVVMEGQFEELTQLNIQQKNISFEPISLKWKKVSVNLPANWKASACDNSNCYTSLVDSGEMLSINPNELGMLMIDITPKVNYGTAIIRYAVWENTNPSQIDTLTYILSTSASLGFDTREIKSEFHVFPIPANESIQIISKSIKSYQYKIIDVLGNSMAMGEEMSNNVYLNTATLSNGLYTILLFSNGKFVDSKKILIQH